ncbi:aldehyde dehydrogenase [Blastocladiella britannica]|nr:aldehyde dehydrogenase [Blastocladiella britannica]
MTTTLHNFIGGAFVPPTTSAYIDSPNPSTGATHVRVPASGPADVDAAVSAASAAFPAWSKLPRAARSQYLTKIADAIEARIDEFAAAESADQGKPVALARAVDIPRAVHNFRFFASAIMHLGTRSTDLDAVPGEHVDARLVNYVRREPIGVAALISPWNLPLYLLTWKIAPCLATGNTCVCKPSEFTSHSAYLLCEVLQSVSLPVGVVNMVFGDGPSAGAALVAHKRVPLISFTGGTATGARIASVAAPMFKKMSLELGGKNAAVVFADADLDRAVATCVASGFRNQGEICLCTSRILVQRSIYPRFLERYAAAVAQLKLGDPASPGSTAVTVGALVSDAHREKVESYIALAPAEGGEIVVGGLDATKTMIAALPSSSRRGFYVAPTVVAGLPRTARCMREEIFGPVVCVSPFDTEADAVQWANDTEYGLCATVWSENLARAHRVAARLDVGTVWVNCWMVRDLNMPFGGVKGSGIGREGWPSSLEFFTEEKTVAVFVGADAPSA